MTFKLAVSNTVDFPVKLTVNDAGTKRDFALRLEGARLAQDTVRDTFASEPDLSTEDFLRRHLTGWRDQRLVLGDDDHPAPWSLEALNCLLGLFGATGVIFAAYLEAIAASAGTGGRAKN